jgi:hypothetical protein
MEAYIQFIKSIEPNQKEMSSVPEMLGSSEAFKLLAKGHSETKSQLVTELEANLDTYAVQLQKQYGISESLQIVPSGRKRSLYTSLLSLIDQKYVTSPTYEEKFAMISESIKFMIAQMTINTRVHDHVQRMKVRLNQLIDEIKDDNYQSGLVVYYLSLLFDVNIIVLTPTSEISKPLEMEFYFAEEAYDNCKPHLIFFRDQTRVYSPVIYGPAKETQLLNYYDHPIVQKLSDSFDKKAICAKDYIKPVGLVSSKTKQTNASTVVAPLNSTTAKTIPKHAIDVDKLENVNLNKLSLVQLREIAESCEIAITKLSEKTGKPINKTKAQLIEDLSSTH